jgi:hypothetical protein
MDNPLPPCSILIHVCVWSYVCLVIGMFRYSITRPPLIRHHPTLGMLVGIASKLSNYKVAASNRTYSKHYVFEILHHISL